MRIAFIVNERASNGRAIKVWEEIARAISVDYSVAYTRYVGHAKELAFELCTESSHLHEQLLIVVIGGDGTIHEVINGVQPFPNVYVGSMSAGSGNDFARGFNAFHSVQQIEDFIINNKLESSAVTDVGVVKYDREKCFFINNAGFGFDAVVALAANRSKLKRFLNYLQLGKLSYGLIVLKTLFSFRFFDITVQCNGEKTTYQRCWFLTASNQPFFGGGMNISPHSKINDGLLELTVVHKLSRWKLLFVFITVYFGKHTDFREVVQLQGETFDVMIHQPMIGHVDGEFLIKTSSNQICTFTVESSNWRIVPVDEN